MKYKLCNELRVFLSVLILFGCSEGQTKKEDIIKSKIENKTYQPTWESLGNYEVPEWYKDAKLGIFIHWGPYAVPAHDSEWYPRRMYRETSDVFDYHKENWGSQEEFGYKDFIPMFRAENFDATE
uniref:alpha-L-fucosidase n=1 Tax=Seonamhaeicola sp. TaxID=1912245 RepID=UPI00261451E2